jgi:hypothetical protein
VAARVFLPSEFALAVPLAVAVEVGLLVLFFAVGQNRAKIVARETPPPEEIPIAVKPVLDDLPLLKLGSKHVKMKLPDMWTKQAPVQRFEEKSAPSPKAEKTPEAIPTSPVATADAAAPPPDAALAKEVDQKVVDAAAPKEEANAPTEGAADGVKQGTETDPLKARALDQYRAKIISWFTVRFHPPTDVPCDVLHGLSASIQVLVGSERSVASYTLTRPSNNPVFDAKVKTTLDGVIGQELPPPPPMYAGELELTPGTPVHLTFSGKEAKCE